MTIELRLADGLTFEGQSFGYEQSVAGEVVFNTAMTGYPESLTDPSYKGQILVLTYPLVGNYGVPNQDVEDQMFRFFESHKIHISGLIISDYSVKYSHWNTMQSLSEWLKKNKIPAMFGVDTRRLTKILREEGTMLGKLIVNGQEVADYDPGQHNLVAEVSTTERVEYGNGKHRILLVDCGVKYNIIRCLLKRDATVIRVPWNHNISSEDYDGLFITNGPGDPKQCQLTIDNLRKALSEDKPIFGICLGNQLLALAAGADSYKLKYGHRGHNQPVIEVGTDKAYVTSQNHGYAISNDSLPKDWEPLFINLNDNTNEGMKHKHKPFFSTQFHPESTGGPTDTEYLFDVFMEKIENSK